MLLQTGTIKATVLMMELQFLLLSLLINEYPALPQRTPAPAPASTEQQCGDPDYVKEPCFDARVKTKLVFGVTEPIHIKCIIHNAESKAVTWMKDGLDMPIAIGTTRFLPDPRIVVDHTRPEEWNLVIARARKSDAGVYRCQINLVKLKEKIFRVFVDDEKSVRRGASQPQQNLDKNFGAGPTKSRQLNDEPNGSLVGVSVNRKQQVSITGAGTVLLGSRDVTLTCRAKYMTKDAKMNRYASVQWWHMGIEQSSSARRGLDISMSWQEGDLLISMLVIAQVNVNHAGRWTCVKRPSEIPGQLEASHHELIVLGRARLGGFQLGDGVRSSPDGIPRSASASVQSSENGNSASRTEIGWTVACITLVVIVSSLNRTP